MVEVTENVVNGEKKNLVFVVFAMLYRCHIVLFHRISVLSYHRIYAAIPLDPKDILYSSDFWPLISDFYYLLSPIFIFKPDYKKTKLCLMKRRNLRERSKFS